MSITDHKRLSKPIAIARSTSLPPVAAIWPWRHFGWTREAIIAGFAIVLLLAAQMMLSHAIEGASYYGWDGRLAETAVLTGFHFSGHFDITAINPLQGVGSQLLTKNAWANPAFWPIDWFDKETATDISAVTALACFAAASYAMMRCFEVPVVTSAVAAQLTIVLFAPASMVLHMMVNFVVSPGDAVAYTPYMLSLGLLARLDSGVLRRFVVTSAAITLLICYSVYCDPLWTMVGAVAWALAFATVTLHPFRLRTIVIRSAALGCCLSIVTVTGLAVYLYTLSHYTYRVQYPLVVDRARLMAYVSAASYSPNMRYWHFVFGLSLLFGLLTGRGRVRALIVASAVSWFCFLAYSVAFFVLNTPWVAPIPIYIEQSLFVLFLAGSATSCWSVLRFLGTLLKSGRERLFPAPRHPSPAAQEPDRPRIGSGRTVAAVATILGLAAVSVVPAKIAFYALYNSRPLATTFYQAWATQPDLARFFEDRLALTVGGPFRGSVNFPTLEADTTYVVSDLWSRQVPTLNEYSQLATPVAFYFAQALTQQTVVYMLNAFTLFWGDGQYSPSYWKSSALLGVRYWVTRWPLPLERNPELHLTTFVYQPGFIDKQPGLWYVYELPNPNLGSYSPTQAITVQTGAEMMKALADPDFDPAQQVMLTQTVPALVTAHDMRFSVIRNGWHLSALSDGTSLVVLPQQFSHCLRATDDKVKLVRADLLVTGIVFSGDINTDITLDYGLLSPWCRLADLRDLKALDLKIDQHVSHLTNESLFLGWRSAWEKLATEWKAIQ